MNEDSPRNMVPGNLISAVEASNLPDQVKEELRKRLEAEERASQLPAQVLDTAVGVAIERAGVAEPEKEALRAMACGVPFQDAVAAAGCEQPKDVWREAVQLGIVQTDVLSLMSAKAQISRLADSRILTKLLDPESDPSLSELNFVSGTAADKILKAKPVMEEKNRFAEIVKLLQTDGGGKMTLEVTPNAKTIDVTPEDS